MVKATLWMKDNGAFIEEQRRKWRSFTLFNFGIRFISNTMLYVFALLGKRAERQRLKEEQAKQPKKVRSLFYKAKNSTEM